MIAEYAGATWHRQFARCPECQNATVGLGPMYAINHKGGCSMPGAAIDQTISEDERRYEGKRAIDDYWRAVARLNELGIDLPRAMTEEDS